MTIRRWFRRILLLVAFPVAALVAAPAGAASPSFDCAKATTSVEKLLCADDGLARQDRMLAAIYAKALRRAGPDEAAAIRAEQRRWAAGRAGACPAIGAGDAAQGADCLAAVYADRLATLRPASLDDLKLYKETNVQADRRSPLACLRFSAPLLAKQAAAPESYVASAGGEALAARIVGNELCVEGLGHGAGYQLTVRAGLQGEGAILRADQTLDVAIPDRPRRVAFASRGLILPRFDAAGRDGAGLPIETVNVDAARLLLLRVDDQDVAEGLAQGVVENEMGYYEVGRVAAKLGRNVWSGEIEIDGERNVARRTAIPIHEIVPDLEPGVYLAILEDPEMDYYEGWRTSSQWFVVSDIGLTALVGQDGLTVAARSLATAATAPGVRVALKAEDGRTLAEAETGADGVARIGAGYLRGEGEDRPRAVFAYGSGGDFVYVDLTRAPLDLSDRGVDGRTPPGALDAYLTADRGVYRPGETVRLTALLRDQAAMAVQDMPVTLKVVRTDGLEVVSRVLQDRGAGGYATELSLPPSAATGVWRATLHAAADGPPIGQIRFLVEDFVPPRLEMSLDAGREGDVLRAEVKADYLYGAPGSNLPGEVIVDVRPATAPVAGYEGYSFGLVQDEAPQSYQAARDAFSTDEAGRAEVRVSVSGGPATSYPLEAVARASIFDIGGRPLTERSVVQLGNLPLMIGLRPAFDGGAEAAFEAMAFAPDGTPVARRLDYTIVREQREYIWFENGGRWDYQVQHYETDVVETGVLATAAGAPARVQRRFEGWGTYRLEATDPETGVAASLRFTAGPWGGALATADDAPDKAKVILPPGPFRPGETIVARIEPPFDAEVTAAVVDGRVGDVRTATIPAGGGEIELTLPTDAAAGAYVLVSAYARADGASSLAPRRAIGAAWAAFDPAPKTIDLAMTAPAETLPERTVDVRLETGVGPGAAYVTLAAVDDGVLALTGYEAPDPKAYYLAKRRLGADLHDVYGRFIDAIGAEPGRIRSGGDMLAKADMAKVDAADLPKKSVKVVALFSGVVETGPDGVAVVPLAIPEFAGRLRLMAQAWTAERVGAAEATMLVRRPAVATLALPRFLAPGDAATATVSLRNLSGPAGAYRATLRVEGPIGAAGGARLEAELAPGDPAARTTFDIAGLEPGDGRIRLDVEGPDGLAFTVERDLSVRPPAPVETFSVSADVPPGGALEPPAGLLDGVYAASARVVVGLNPLPDMDLPEILVGLARYPYGCAEQTTSTAAPLLYAGDLARQMGVASADRPKDAVAKGVERLLGMQTYTGGFGFWRGDYEASPWITAYAADFLADAAKAGVDVPADAFGRALDRLSQLVDDQDRYDPGQSAAAYALYVRAKAGVADPARARRFADLIASRRPPALTLAFAGGALAAVGDRAAAGRMFERAVVTGAMPAETRYRLYGSEVRDRALVLALMAESGAVAWPRLKAEAEALGLAVRRREWLSTQEQAWIVRAAAALGRSADAAGFAVSVDGGRVDGVGAGLYRAALGGAPLPRLVNLGQETVTGVVTIVGAAKTPAPAVDAGFAIRRSYFSETGDRLDPETIRQNDLVVVLLEGAQTAEGRAHALVVDYLPAGLELENAALGGEELGAYAWLGALTATEHRELRDDRFVAAFDSEGGADFRLAYLARAVTPGRYVSGGPRVEAMYQPEQFGRGVPGDMVVGAR